MSLSMPIDEKSEFIPSANPFRRLGQHPIGFWFVFSGELAERASYYGMRTLLALYMIDVLGFTETAQDGRYGLALMIPAVLMAVAFGAFAFGKRWYALEDVRAERPPKTREQREAERRTLIRIAGVFAAIAVFWLIYDQNADTWIYFAESHTDLHLFGSVGLTSNQMQALNPVFIVVLTPVFNSICNLAK